MNGVTALEMRNTVVLRRVPLPVLSTRSFVNGSDCIFLTLPFKSTLAFRPRSRVEFRRNQHLAASTKHRPRHHGHPDQTISRLDHFPESLSVIVIFLIIIIIIILL